MNWTLHIVFSIVTVLFSNSCYGQSDNTRELKISDFPLSMGSSWVYVSPTPLNVNDSSQFHWREFQSCSIDTFGGKKVLRISYGKHKVEIGQCNIIGDKLYFDLVERLALEFPLKVGKEYSFQIEPESWEDIDSAKTVRIEDIRTQAGMFKDAFVVEHSIHGLLKAYVWIAPNIGIVKVACVANEIIMSQFELQSYTIAKEDLRR